MLVLPNPDLKISGISPGCLHRPMCVDLAFAIGSFGAMDPASNDLYMFLEKLQQQQKEVVALIKERQRIIAARNGDSPSPVTADAAVMGVSPSLKSVTGLYLMKHCRCCIKQQLLWL